MNRRLSILAREGSLIWSLIAVVVSGLLFATVQLLMAYSRAVAPNLALVRTWYLGGAVAAIVGWAILSFLSYFIAILLMHTSEVPIGITSFLRVSGYAMIPFAFWNVPWMGWLIPIVGVAFWILASKHGFQCNLERAVIVSLPIIVAYLLLAMMPSSPMIPSGRVD